MVETQETVILTQLNLNMQARDLERMAMANGCTNMAMLDIQLKSSKKLANWSWFHLNRLILSRVIHISVISLLFVSDLHCKNADIFKTAATLNYVQEN